MRRRPALIVVSGLCLLGLGVAAGCGSQGVAEPVPNTVIGTLPKPTTRDLRRRATRPSGSPSTSRTAAAAATPSPPPARTGKVGPDLDQLPEYAKKAGEPLDEFTSGAITNPPPKYVPPGYPTNVMPTTFGQSIKPQQLADLVAFLTQKS